MLSPPGVAGDGGAALEKAATEGDGGEERENRGEREKEKRRQMVWVFHPQTGPTLII